MIEHVEFKMSEIKEKVLKRICQFINYFANMKI